MPESPNDEDDGAWQFHHGHNVNIEDAMIISLAKIVSLDNTLNQLSDLPLGWFAIRQSINSSIKITKIQKSHVDFDYLFII